MTIGIQDVSVFKSELCDENQLIAEILKSHFSRFMPPVILDVGAGMGDLALMAFPEKEALLLDPLPYEFQISPHHERVVSDFFTFAPSDTIRIGTLFFCHSLQFFDSDLARLNAKTLGLAPSVIVTVTNTNLDLLGSLIKELRAAGHDFNAEEDLPSFPPQEYWLKMEHTLTGNVQAESFEELAGAVGYLLDAPNDSVLARDCERLLRAALPTPTLTIDQTIRLFHHEE